MNIYPNSGVMGVVWHKISNSWRVTYTRETKIKYFKSLEDAITHRKKLEYENPPTRIKAHSKPQKYCYCGNPTKWSENRKDYREYCSRKCAEGCPILSKKRAKSYNKMKGYYKPRNPNKYKGNISNIIYRSSWELRYMIHLDDNKNVLQWNSEEIYVPYKDKATGRFRLYFPDFWYKTKDKEYLIEIKPFVQTQPPIKRNKKTYINEMRTFITNNSKWDAAKKFATNRGMDFVVLTENELNNLNK